ncbi:MAG: hypothetical protein RJQ09_03330 [Cyclobacteriaceae bacterium]
MKLNRLMALAVSFLMISVSAKSQDFLAAEQVTDLSKKAAKDFPSNIIVDDQKQQIDLIYTTKAKSKKIKFDVLQFDYDLNLINEFSDEQEIENARNKYSWFGKKYRGEEYTVEQVTAEPNLTGKLVLKKQSIRYYYSWFSGKYKTDVKNLDKLKFKAPSGRKLTYRGHYNHPETGELTVLGGEPDKFFIERTYSLMKIDTDLNVVSEEKIDMMYPQAIIYNNLLDIGTDDESIPKDWILVMAAAGGKGVKSKDADPNNRHYTYIRISPAGTVKERIDFDTKAHDWAVTGAVERDGAVYLYGAANAKGVEDKYQTMYVYPQKSYDAFQLVKISGGKASFVSAPTNDDIAKVNTKPKGQKKISDYNGKKVQIRGISTGTGTGDVFITAQDFSTTQDATVFKDVYMFHFTKDGVLKRFYGLSPDQDKGGLAGKFNKNNDARTYPTNGSVIEGSGDKAFWLMEVVADIYTYKTQDSNWNLDGSITTTTTTYYIPRRNLQVATIDTKDGALDDFTTLGGGEFFLYNETPFVSINGGKQVVYLGWGGDKGRQLWMGKFDPATL